MITQETFAPFAFPVVRVKYAGPTERRGARWIATLRRDSERTYRVTVPYDDALSSGPQNALGAAQKCWEKALVELSGGFEAPHIAIPGDLNADSYSFTMVPAYFFNGRES